MNVFQEIQMMTLFIAGASAINLLLIIGVSIKVSRVQKALKEKK